MEEQDSVLTKIDGQQESHIVKMSFDIDVSQYRSLVSRTLDYFGTNFSQVQQQYPEYQSIDDFIKVLLREMLSQKIAKIDVEYRYHGFQHNDRAIRIRDMIGNQELCFDIDLVSENPTCIEEEINLVKFSQRKEYAKEVYRMLYGRKHSFPKGSYGHDRDTGDYYINSNCGDLLTYHKKLLIKQHTVLCDYLSPDEFLREMNLDDPVSFDQYSMSWEGFMGRYKMGKYKKLTYNNQNSNKTSYILVKGRGMVRVYKDSNVRTHEMMLPHYSFGKDKNFLLVEEQDIS